MASATAKKVGTLKKLLQKKEAEILFENRFFGVQ